MDVLTGHMWNVNKCRCGIEPETRCEFCQRPLCDACVKHCEGCGQVIGCGDCFIEVEGEWYCGADCIPEDIDA